MIPIVLVRLFGVARDFCRRRSSLSAGVLVIGLAIAFLSGLRLVSRRPGRALPATLATQLAAHAVATQAETVAVASIVREARADSVATARAVTRVRPHEAAAKRASGQADSLARLEDWQQAYDGAESGGESAPQYRCAPGHSARRGGACWNSARSGVAAHRATGRSIRHAAA